MGTYQTIVEPANSRSSGGTVNGRLLAVRSGEDKRVRTVSLPNKRRLAAPPVLALVLALTLAHSAAPSLAQSPAPNVATAKYELPPIPDEFNDADAVILSWDQTWTVAPDGSITQRENRRVLIRHDRAIGAFADPRITYNKDWQTVKIITARSLLPDGRVLDVPAYSRNTVAPGESAGWPAFAAIEQIVLTYSAVEPGAILELAWERVTKPGMKGGAGENLDLQIAERIAVDYPTLNRTITIESDKKPSWNTTQTWKNVAANRDESNSIPATERAEYFCFNNDSPSSQPPNYDARLDALVARLGEDTRKKVAADVTKWVTGKLDAMAKAREIQHQFSGYFNIVNVDDAFLPDALRPLDEVYTSRYGSRREATALLLAIMKEAGLSVEPYLVTASLGGAKSGQKAIVSYGILLDAKPGPSFWTAAGGRVREPLSGRNQQLVVRSSADGASKSQPPVAFSDDPAALTLNGNLIVAVDHTWSGHVDIHCTGVFFDSLALRGENDRKDFARGVLERLIPKCTVESTSIASLSDDELHLGAKVKSSEPLSTADSHRLLQLSAAGPYSRSIDVPLANSIRRTDLRLASRFEETISLTIELPKDITRVSMPREFDRKGDWGVVRQSATRTENGVTFERHIAVNKRDIPAADYPALRDALSDIQTDSARTFIWKTPAEEDRKVNWFGKKLPYLASQLLLK